jgi:hypothetical protein
MAESRAWTCVCVSTRRAVACDVLSLDQVQRKAQTIMRQADDGDGCITLEEFHVIAARFPNIIFPNFD